MKNCYDDGSLKSHWLLLRRSRDSTELFLSTDVENYVVFTFINFASYFLWKLLSLGSLNWLRTSFKLFKSAIIVWRVKFIDNVQALLLSMLKRQTNKNFTGFFQIKLWAFIRSKSENKFHCFFRWASSLHSSKIEFT